MPESHSEILEWELTHAEKEISNLREQIAIYQDALSDYQNSHSTIFDIEDFKFRLSLDNLLTFELEEAIDIYLKYYNKDFIGGE